MKEIKKKNEQGVPSQQEGEWSQIEGINQQQQEPQVFQNEVEQENNLDEEARIEKDDLEVYKDQLTNKGVCYMSRIPPYMKPNYIRRLLESYGIQRIYLLPESQWTRKNRIKKGGNKKICFRQGWIQFNDKRMAKLAALSLNGQKMVHKKGNFYSQDLWNLKYLPKLKWYNLTERLAHEQRLKKQRLKIQLDQQKKIDDFYSENLAKSKTINAIVRQKKEKGKKMSGQIVARNFQQYRAVQQIKDQ